MNYLLFFFAFILLQANADDAQEQRLAEIRTKCVADNGMTKDDISQTKSLTTFLDNPKAKCYLKCVAESLGLFNDDNTFNIEKAIGYLKDGQKNSGRPILTNCAEAGGIIPDRCEKAFLSSKCVKEVNPPMFANLGIFEPVKQ